MALGTTQVALELQKRSQVRTCEMRRRWGRRLEIIELQNSCPMRSIEEIALQGPFANINTDNPDCQPSRPTGAR